MEHSSIPNCFSENIIDVRKMAIRMQTSICDFGSFFVKVFFKFIATNSSKEE
jgi:hypothetical protein